MARLHAIHHSCSKQQQSQSDAPQSATQPMPRPAGSVHASCCSATACCWRRAGTCQVNSSSLERYPSPERGSQAYQHLAELPGVADCGKAQCMHVLMPLPSSAPILHHPSLLSRRGGCPLRGPAAPPPGAAPCGGGRWPAAAPAAQLAPSAAALGGAGWARRAAGEWAGGEEGFVACCCHVVHLGAEMRVCMSTCRCWWQLCRWRKQWRRRGRCGAPWLRWRGPLSPLRLLRTLTPLWSLGLARLWSLLGLLGVAAAGPARLLSLQSQASLLRPQSLLQRLRRQHRRRQTKAALCPQPCLPSQRHEQRRTRQQGRRRLQPLRPEGAGPACHRQLSRCKKARQLLGRKALCRRCSRRVPLSQGQPSLLRPRCPPRPACRLSSARPLHCPSRLRQRLHVQPFRVCQVAAFQQKRSNTHSSWRPSQQAQQRQPCQQRQLPLRHPPHRRQPPAACPPPRPSHQR